MCGGVLVWGNGGGWRWWEVFGGEARWWTEGGSREGESHYPLWSALVLSAYY